MKILGKQAGITNFDNTIFVSVDTQINSNIKIEHSINNSIDLVLTIPLLNVKQETIKIEFKKENINIKNQFKKLKKKYLNIMKIEFPDGNYDNSDSIIHNNMNNNDNNNVTMIFNNQINSSDEILKKIKKELLGSNQMIRQKIMENNMVNNMNDQMMQQQMMAQQQMMIQAQAAKQTQINNILNNMGNNNPGAILWLDKILIQCQILVLAHNNRED